MDEELLRILACPVCKASLRLEGDGLICYNLPEGERYDFEGDGLICTETGVRYPVDDGIPILLAERAEPEHPEPPAHTNGTDA